VKYRRVQRYEGTKGRHVLPPQAYADNVQTEQPVVVDQVIHAVAGLVASGEDPGMIGLVAATDLRELFR
jgi:hypothetical protein